MDSRIVLTPDFVAPGTDVVDLLLRAFEQKIGVLAGGGLVQDGPGGVDQAATLVLLLDDFKIGINVRDRGQRLGDASQIDLGVVGAGKRLVAGKRIDKRDNVNGLALGVERAHRLIDGAVLVRVEHLGLHVGDEAVQHRFIHQRRTQHALLCLHVVGQVDAHAFQIQFIGIMSFVRHGSLSFCIISLKSQKAPPAVRGRRWQKNQACSTSTMILKEATTPTCRRTLPLNTPASLMSLVSSSIFFLSMGAPAS